MGFGPRTIGASFGSGCRFGFGFRTAITLADRKVADPHRYLQD
jgi:hypothetical protein